MTDLPHRIRTLARCLDSLEVDAMLVTDPINVRYLSGFTGDSSYALVEKSGSQNCGATILSDRRYETQIAQECPSLRSAIRPPEQGMPSLVQQVIGDSSHRRIGVESMNLSLATFAALVDQSPDIEWVQTGGVVERQRMIKDADEIRASQRAIEIAQLCFQSVVPMLTPRSSELAIAYDLEAKMRFLGAQGVSFPPIVAAGPAGALPHYQPTDVRIGDAATLLVDWGASYDGYASDLTRTLHRGHASDKFRRAYEVVLEAQQAAIDAIAPGVEASTVDSAARRVIQKASMGDAFKHGLGHGTGLQIHEAPRMSSSSDETLASGMIVTVEPGVYFEGDFGIRIEDDVLVTDQGREVLSNLPKGLDDCRLML